MPFVSANSVCRSAAGAVLLAGLLGTKAALAQYEPPPPPLTTAPCVPTKKAPCVTTQATPSVKTPDAAQQFPFPGDEKKPAEAKPADGKSTSEEFPFPEDTPTPVSPTAKHGQPVPPTDASKQFPFPPDDAPASSSSSSSSSSSDPNAANPDAANPDAPNPDAPELKDMGSDGSTRAARRRLPKVESMSDRETEDLNVSKYYMSTGNIKGAYLRAQDAVKSVPDDPEAHFALAQTARKLNKKDEAVAEFNAYLKLEPDGRHAKAVLEALSDLK